MAARCPKWSKGLKEKFKSHIIHRRINPLKSDKQYIETVHAAYFPDRPYSTFRKNYLSSVSEWNSGQEFRKADKLRRSSKFWLVLFFIIG